MRNFHASWPCPTSTAWTREAPAAPLLLPPSTPRSIPSGAELDRAGGAEPGREAEGGEGGADDVGRGEPGVGDLPRLGVVLDEAVRQHHWPHLEPAAPLACRI